MARPDKAAAVAELTEDFKSATATYLTEYRGLTVTSMKKLRRSLGEDTKYSVVKNTLTKIAAKNTGVDLSLMIYLQDHQRLHSSRAMPSMLLVI